VVATGAGSPAFAELVARQHRIVSGWDMVSVGLALLFGFAGLPHVMMRFFTVRDADAARRSAIGGVVAGLLINAASAVVRDLWPRRGAAGPDEGGRGDDADRHELRRAGCRAARGHGGECDHEGEHRHAARVR